MSASAVVRDLLGSTSLLLDRSDEICEETRRLARAVASRRGPADASAIQKFTIGGVDGGALAVAAAKGSGDDTQLARALADARSVATSIAAMQADRDMVVAARRDAIAKREESMKEGRTALAAELQEATRCAAVPSSQRPSIPRCSVLSLS